jgi:hypothetical protein
MRTHLEATAIQVVECSKRAAEGPLIAAEARGQGTRRRSPSLVKKARRFGFFANRFLRIARTPTFGTLGDQRHPSGLLQLRPSIGAAGRSLPCQQATR